MENQIVESKSLKEIGQIVNKIAGSSVFQEYQQKIAKNTVRRHKSDLALFEEYISETTGILNKGMMDNPESWSGMSWGLIKGFVHWMMNKGYSISSVNVRLSTVKAYATLATQSGFIREEEYSVIRTVKGFAPKEYLRADENRNKQNLNTRLGSKKGKHHTLSIEQIKFLKNHHENTPQGIRDRFIMCLFLDHGLRCSEVANLKTEDINFYEGSMTFYREKVQKRQTHILSVDSFKAFLLWMPYCLENSFLLRSSKKGGELLDSGISTRALTKRVRYFGKKIGIDNLSAHDLRHNWATYAAKETDLFSLQEAGGWTTLHMARRYVDQQKISNSQIKMPY